MLVSRSDKDPVAHAVHIILSDSNNIGQLSAICHLFLVGGHRRSVLDMVAALQLPTALNIYSGFSLTTNSGSISSIEPYFGSSGPIFSSSMFFPPARVRTVPDCFPMHSSSRGIPKTHLGFSSPERDSVLLRNRS